MKLFEGGSQLHAVAKDILKVHNRLHIVFYQCEQNGKTKTLKTTAGIFFLQSSFILHTLMSALSTITFTYVCNMHPLTRGYADLNRYKQSTDKGE